MRKGVYWLNLMTRDEQIGWHCWCGVYIFEDGFGNRELQSYRNFEEFIKNTVMQHMSCSIWTENLTSQYWRGIINKYSVGLNPKCYIKKHFLCKRPWL